MDAPPFDPESNPRPPEGSGKPSGLFVARRLADPGARYSDEEHRLALKLKKVYTEEMRRYLVSKGREGGAYYEPSRAFDGFDNPGPEQGKPRPAVWLKVARAVVARGYDVEEYVRAQFEVFRQEGPPTPAHLLSDRSVQSYEYARDAAPSEAVPSLSTQVHVARTRILEALSADRSTSPHDAWRRVISDPTLQLTPLFRYCLAASEGLEFADMAESFKEDAALQYCRNPRAYDSEWRDVIPRSFPAEAAKIAERLSGAEESP